MVDERAVRFRPLDRFPGDAGTYLQEMPDAVFLVFHPMARGRDRVALSPTVEQLFVELENAIYANDRRVSRVRFHPELGYPVAWTSHPAMPISLERLRVAIHDFRTLR